MGPVLQDEAGAEFGAAVATARIAETTKSLENMVILELMLGRVVNCW